MPIKRSDINSALLAQSPNRAKTIEQFPWAGKYRKPNQTAKHPEQDLQIACVDYLKLFPDILFFSVPNHLYRGKNTNEGAYLNYMVKQKRMGLRAGASDLIIGFRNTDGMSVTCAAELKCGYNKLTDEQKSFTEKANTIGWYTATVKSIECLTALLKTARHSRHV